jgi:hypothetical protein
MKTRAILRILWLFFGPKLKKRAAKIGKKIMEKHGIEWDSEIAEELFMILRAAVMKGKGFKLSEEEIVELALSAAARVKDAKVK